MTRFDDCTSSLVSLDACLYDLFAYTLDFAPKGRRCVNVSVAYLIGRETRPPAERVRERLALAMMSHDGIMSIQTAHLSLSMHGCVCAGIQKTRLAIPFRKSGRTRRTRGGKEVAKSRLPATQQREPAHLRSSLLLHREWGTFEQNQSSQHPTRWEICSASKLYCAAAIAVSLLTRRSFFLFQHFAKWPIK